MTSRHVSSSLAPAQAEAGHLAFPLQPPA